VNRESSSGGACLDSDNDGWTDAGEVVIGTDPLDARADNATDNAWPADINNDHFSDIVDLIFLTGNFGTAVAPAPARFNIAPDPAVQAPDAFVDITDIIRITAMFGQGCT